MGDNSRRLATMRALGDGDVGLWCHFDDKDRAKGLPSARWDPGLKCWRVKSIFTVDAQRLVDDLNGGIDTALLDALATTFRRIPAPLREPTFKQLAKLWHPDAGGDLKAMQALNGAWQQVKP